MTKAFRQIGMVVLVVLAASGVWQAAAQVEVKKERPKWEYTVTDAGPTGQRIGEDGWELVAVNSNGGHTLLYFKRQK